MTVARKDILWTTFLRFRRNAGELRLPYIERNAMFCLILMAILPLVNFMKIVMFPQEHMSQKFRDIETIVVLGHHLKKGELSEDAKHRLEEALGILRRFQYKPTIVLSGIDNEVVRMQSYLEDHITGYEIVCESNSRTTAQNLQHCASMFGDKTVIVSSAYHLFRIQMILDKCNQKAILVPARSDIFLSECVTECYKYVLDYIRVRKEK